MHRSDAFRTRGGTGAPGPYKFPTQSDPNVCRPDVPEAREGAPQGLLREAPRFQKKASRRRHSHRGAHRLPPFGSRHPKRESCFLVTGAAANHPRPSYDSRPAIPPAPSSTGCILEKRSALHQRLDFAENPPRYGIKYFRRNITRTCFQFHYLMVFFSF